jgi:hypothetical protein
VYHTIGKKEKKIKMDNFDLKKYLVEGKLFKDYLEEQPLKFDPILNSYFKGYITESELSKSLEDELNLLTENIIKKTIDSAADWLIGKLASLYNMAVKAGKKVLSAVKSLFKALSKFRSKYPRVYKIFIILILLLIFLVLTTSTAQAASSGVEPPITLYDAAIGILEQVKIDSDGTSKSIDIVKEIANAQTYILNLKNGNTLPSEFGEEALKNANWAMDAVKDIVQDARQGGDKGFEAFKYLDNLSETGSKLISSSVKVIKSSSSELTKINQNWAK